MDEPKSENQLDLMAFVKTIAGSHKWEHSHTQWLADGRLIIHLKIEKICLLCGKPFNEEHKLDCINNKK